VFVKEMEAALVDGEVDAAVHSLKDLPTAQPSDLWIAAVPDRADPRDALVTAGAPSLAALRDGATVGTSSPRRKAQLLAARPSLAVVPVRGNVGTRLGRAVEGDLDAVVLAVAGLERLGKGEVITERLAPEVMLPAPGQGALAVECRAGDRTTRQALAPLDDPRVAACVRAERQCLAALGGGCHTPMGALGRVHAGLLLLQACVCSVDGARLLRAEGRGRLDDAVQVGEGVAADLLRAGAEALIAEAG
jgi:hydroxymethylbilane synthase